MSAIPPHYEYLVLSRGQWDEDAPKAEIEDAIEKFYTWLAHNIAEGRMKMGSRLSTERAALSLDYSPDLLSKTTGMEPPPCCHVPVSLPWASLPLKTPPVHFHSSRSSGGAKCRTVEGIGSSLPD
jgi:hypothetical protein